MLFEVQFHTRISFEAKQLTHGAYERLRSQQADAFEGTLTLEKAECSLERPRDAGGGASRFPRRAEPTYCRAIATLKRSSGEIK